MGKKKELNFESSLQRLQEISEQLDQGELGLDDSIKLYEEGINLANICYTKLKDAELKVTELKKQLEINIKE